MEKPLAYCGLDCAECPTYLATQADDDQRRAQVAGQWSRQFGMKLAPADINCDGCRSTGGRLFGHCLGCKVRACAQAKVLANCAVCDDYPCHELAAFHDFAPQARRALEALRAAPGH